MPLNPEQSRSLGTSPAETRPDSDTPFWRRAVTKKEKWLIYGEVLVLIVGIQTIF
jgi:hypothetical protein